MPGPLIAAAGIGLAGSVASGALAANASKKAASAQAKSADKASRFQKDSAIQSRIDAYPWALNGALAMYKYMDELGIQRPKNMILPDITAGPFGRGSSENGGIKKPSQIALTDNLGFQQTAGYKFQMDQGQKSVINNAAALGMKNSGATMKALTRFGTGLASQEYGNYLNRLAGIAGMGQSQVNQTNALTQNASNNIAQNINQSGAARASGYVGAANAWGNAISGASNTIGSALGAWKPGGGLTQ